MNENLRKSVMLNYPLVPGIALLVPLMANATFMGNMYLGSAALLSLLIVTVLTATLIQRLPPAARTGVAIVLSGGTLSAGAVISSLLPVEAKIPLETIAPLLLLVSIIAVHTEAYDVKKRLQPALLDAAGIGALFFALLVVCGLLRDFALLSFISQSPAVTPFLGTLPGILLIVCGAVALIAGVVTIVKARRP